MSNFGAFALPILIGIIIFCGIIKKVGVFDCFLEGAKQSLAPSLSILPSLIGLIFAVSLLRASGALDLIVRLLSPVAELLGIPSQVMPLAVISPISGSGSLAVFDGILSQYGPDSFIGRVASVMVSSSETSLYAVTVYYGAVAIKRTRHTLAAALTADAVCFIISALTVKLFF
ncbi:MAG: spore maturation protein [Clostridia bacterium]|nr:spore maturation protein [Clostridia bacterium]